MDRDKAKKGIELIEEIDELNSNKNMINNHSGTHFEFVEHYAQAPHRILIDKRHTPKFIKVLENIINELEQELLDL